MADLLFIKIYEAEKKNNSNTDLTLVPGKELQDVKDIKSLLDNAIKVYKPKKLEQKTADACRQLRDLFNTNATQAKAEWDKIVKEAQQEYEKKFNDILKLKNLSLYTEADVSNLQSQLPLWSEEYIKQKLGSKFIDYGKPAKPVIKEDAFFSRWSTILGYLNKCKEYLEQKHTFTFSESVISWMDILRYWKFISPLYEKNDAGRKEDVYTGFDTTTLSGLKRLQQQFDLIFKENRSNSSLNGREYQKELEEISKFLRDCCDSVDRFNGYKLRLEKSNHEGLVERILLLVNLNTKSISSSDFKVAADLAKSANVSDAELFVKQVLSESKISIPIESKAPQSAQQTKTKRCPNCGSNNDENLSICPKCGFALRVQCPKCKKTVSSEHKKCIYCGFDIGNQSVANEKIQLAKEALRKGNLAECEKNIIEVKILWPSHSQIDILQSQLEILKEQKNKAQVQKDLNDLNVSGQATITLTGRIVRIAWSACPRPAGLTADKKINYRIVRKDDAIPSNNRDGAILSTTSNLFYEDTSIVPGQVYGYAVFPCINDVPHDKSFQGSKVMATCGVSQLRAAPNDKSIQLSWELPDKAIRVRIYRKTGSSITKASEGVLLKELSACNGFTDTSVQTGVTYGYWIVPIFTGVSGKDTEGSGQSIQCHTSPLPLPVTDLKHAKQSDFIAFSWTPPKFGEVKLFISSSELGAQGESKPINDSVFARATVVTESDSAKGRAIFRGVITNVQYITPVSFNKFYGVIGKAIQITNIKDVANIKVSRTNGKIFLSWDWDAADKEFLVMIRNDAHPTSPADPKAYPVTITRQSYDLERAFIVNSVGTENYFFAVFRIGNAQGEKKYSRPALCRSIGQKGRTIISYNFYKKKQYFLFGEEEYFVHIQVDSSEGHIPELVLIKKNNTQPLRRNDGIKIMDVPSSYNRSCNVQIPIGLIEKGACLKLFVKSDLEVDMYQINDPASDNMRVRG